MNNEVVDIITEFSKVMGAYLVKSDGSIGNSEGFKTVGGFGDYLPIVFNDYLNLHKENPDESFSVGTGGNLSVGSDKIFLNMTNVTLKAKTPREITKRYKPLTVDEFKPFEGNIAILEIINVDIPSKNKEECLNHLKNTLELLRTEEEESLDTDKHIDTYETAIAVLERNDNAELSKTIGIKVFRILVIPYTGSQLYVDEYNLTIGDEASHVVSFKNADSVDLLRYSFLKPTEEEIEDQRRAEELIEVLEKYLYNRSVHGLLSDPVARTFNIVTHFESYSDLLNPSVRASGTLGYISIEDFLEGTYNLSMFEVIRTMMQKLQGRVFKKFLLEDIKSFTEFLEFYLKERTDVDEE